MIGKIPLHYSMTNPASAYDEEALTALELAGRTAQKVNECVDTVNEAHEYFVENFAENVDNSVDALAKDGTLETMLVKSVSSGKVDKNGIGQVSYNMLAQDVREKFTGGNVPVVGADAVSTANIVDGSITESKLTNNLKRMWFYGETLADYYTPILILKKSDYSASINPNFTSTKCRVLCRDTLFMFEPDLITVDATMWTTGLPSIYYKPDTKVFHVVNVGVTNNITKMSVYLGSFGSDSTDIIIPVEYDGYFFIGGKKKLFRHLPLTAMRVEVYEPLPYDPKQAFFNIDWETGAVTFTQPTKVINFPVETLIFSCDFSKATVDVIGHSATNGHLCVYFNPFKQRFIFMPTNTKAWASVDDCLYLGKVTPPVTSDAELIGKNSCILPHTINNTHYVHPKYKNRPIGKLIVDNSEAGLNVVAVKIDYTNRKLIIPKQTRVFIMGNDSYMSVFKEGTTNQYVTHDADYEIPFVNGDNQYLVGCATGLRLVSPNEYKVAWGKHNMTGLWDLGFINVRAKESHLHCKAERCVKFSILGDSVSTFANMIPAENISYYTGSNCGITSYKQTWWGRVADALGWKVCVNNSYSGSQVTDTSNAGAMHRASLLHTATETPDVIFFGMGGNDFNKGKELGSVYSDSEFDYVRTGENSSAPDFASAYITTLYKLKKNYPKAKIYTFTFFPSLRYPTRVNGTYTNGCNNAFPPSNKNNVRVTVLNDIIRKASEICGVECIDLWTAGYTFDNASQYFGDFVSDTASETFGYHQHQNAEGMKLWANKVINHVKHSQGVF